jgi:hypothetical protein
MSDIIINSGDTVNVSVQQESAARTIVIPTPTTSVSVKGVTGGGGEAHYAHTQSTPEAVWEVTHNLGKKPSVIVVDSADTVVMGEIEYINLNSVRLTFVGAFSGKAYFN